MKEDSTKEDNVKDGEQSEDTTENVEENTITLYTNSVNLAVGYYDFQFLFKEQYPSFTRKGTSSTNPVRLIMSPQHAKILNIILKKHIKDYEKNFGEISGSEKFLEDINLKTEGQEK